MGDRATDEMEHTIDVLREELARVRKAFRIYANHLDNCAVVEQQVCSCGFAEIAHSVETGTWNSTT